MTCYQVCILSEIAELKGIKLNFTKSLEQKKAEESEITVQTNEYKSCFEGIVNARNTLTKLSKKNGSPGAAKPKKEDTEVRPQREAKKLDQPIDDEFWFEAPKPNSKQASKPKAKQKKGKS